MVLISIFVFKYNCINIRVVIFKKKIKKNFKGINMVLLIKRVLCLFYLLILIINYSINKSCLYMYC